MFMLRIALCLLVTLAMSRPSPVSAAALSEADLTAARIMVYFTIGRDESPVTNVTVEQFTNHLEELQKGNYHVAALPDIITAYEAGENLPENTVAITFDGGDKSIIENAAPLLEKFNFPYTVFIATDRAGESNPRYLNWEDIRQLKKSGLATIGLHPQVYGDISGDNTVSIRSGLNNATTSLREELSENAELFAYPFGSYNATYKDIISAYGFKAAFGQQSGVAYKDTDHFALPRFTMTEDYANIDRFKMTISALPLPTLEATPDVSHISNINPAIGFSVPDNISPNLTQLSCFATGQDKPIINILGNRIELRLVQPVDQTRFRVNCTLPAADDAAAENQRWRWLGILLTYDETMLETVSPPASDPLPQ